MSNFTASLPAVGNNGLEKFLDGHGRQVQRAGPDEVQKIDREVLEALSLRDDAFHPPSLGSIVAHALGKKLGVAFEGGQGVTDLMGQDRRELAQGAQPSLLLHGSFIGLPTDGRPPEKQCGEHEKASREGAQNQ